MCVCAPSKVGSHLSAASYQRTADYVKASSDALSDNVKSLDRSKIAKNVKSHNKVSEIKRKSIVINDEDSENSSGSSHVTSVSHMARDSRSEVLVRSSHGHSKVTKATTDKTTDAVCTMLDIKMKKQASPGACSNDIKLKAYTGDGYVKHYLERFRYIAVNIFN